jgi:hypothetical protein
LLKARQCPKCLLSSIDDYSDNPYYDHIGPNKKKDDASSVPDYAVVIKSGSSSGEFTQPGKNLPIINSSNFIFFMAKYQFSQFPKFTS